MKVEKKIWSSQLNNQPKQLNKKTEKNFRLDWESNPDLCDDRTQCSMNTYLMDRALHLVIAKVTFQIPVKPDFFSVSFQPLMFLIQLCGSFPLS